MELLSKINKRWTALDPRIRQAIETVVEKIPLTKTIKSLPFLQKVMDDEFSKILAKVDHSAAYLEDLPSFMEIPNEGLASSQILMSLTKLSQQEHAKWADGFASGAVYHGDPKHIQLLNKVYELFSQSNPLHTDLWPSLQNFEAEIVSMTAKMLGAEWTDTPICGCVSSGGTESILLAMKAYRDRARAEKGIDEPEMILPVTAHPAFDKACQYFGIKKISIPMDSNYQASVIAVRKAITKNTIVIVGSAPSFPHGIIDPIPELANLATEKNIGLHVDACLGGFILAWIRDDVTFPPFDFSLKGVTSMSVDTHKFGYAAKGTSVILYRDKNLRHYQYYVTTDWPGGLYASPTLAGSRPGALSAQCWAAMLSMGQNGYRQAALKIVESARLIKEGISKIPELKILGDPIFVIAFASESLNIFSIMNAMTERGWSLNGLHRPDCVHICVTLRHTQTGVVERFLNDLEKSVDEVKKNPQAEEGRAPIYGMASTLPARGFIGEFLKRYLDSLYKN